jgi:hypothetical protein
MAQVIKDSEFTLVSELVKTDSKRRISLGLSSSGTSTVYQIYTNRLGQIVLDPVRPVPAYETWLFDNPGTLAAVKRGLIESAEGKTVDLGSFAEFAED